MRADLLHKFSIALGASILSPGEAAQQLPESLPALILDGNPTESEWVRIEQAIQPGGLVAFVPTDPDGTVEASQAEQVGFRVWDVIYATDNPTDLIGCPKPTQAERDWGLQGVVEPVAGHDAVKRKEGSAGTRNARAGAGRTRDHVLNNHPTVKPTRVMQTLVRICMEGREGPVLDLFGGSGTTGVGAVLEGHDAVLVDLDPHHGEIAAGRVAATHIPVRVVSKTLSGADRYEPTTPSPPGRDEPSLVDLPG